MLLHMSKDAKHIHFIGVGGIGTSALAQYYLAKGNIVSGSDADSSDITNALATKGITVQIGHKVENVRGADMVIHPSPAVGKGNIEYDSAKHDKIPTISYAQAVGEITKGYTTIAISGSHGKSTTTAMIARIMIEAGLDPTVIVGTKMYELGGNNFRMGKSQYMVLEADDFNRHFHNYFPAITVITNIDKEHLDIYKDLDGVKQAFGQFITNTKPGGTIIANGQDSNTIEVIGSRDLSKNHVVLYNANAIAHHELGVVGEYNQSNAEAAYMVASELGINSAQIAKSLAGFKGSWRRLEEIREGIYSDYAHHPTEIKATLRALKSSNPTKQLVCVFQPHQRHRLNELFDDFSKCFEAADMLYLLPLYAVRGRDDGVGKSSRELAEQIKNPPAIYRSSFDKAFNEVSALFVPGNIVVFMGAGDIDEQLRARI